ncbi:hypothetical protein AMS68_005168 [Peltaster fructicola]|uniref:SnoaL-like domain-containing protein n=1 Tax=Peltaster fructicola TaxID=286661 RepID=A0A6H0XYB2_9PEZI|nr:hypothetical protein AMS68_005168 [Peltaster fructicola]
MSQTPDAAVAVVRKFVIEVQQDGKLDLIPQLIHKDCIDHSAQPGSDGEYAGVGGIIQYLHSVITNMKVDIVHCVNDGDIVATNKVFRGVQAGDLFGKPATNKQIEMRVMDFVKIVDGKVKEHWATLGQVVDL